MRFYTETHQHYCGIDLHARTMYVCILDREGQVLLHRNLPCDPERFLRTIAPYREDLVVAVECIFTWYWLADLCAKEDIAFVLGHALYMKAIHGAKAKNDKIDSKKTAALLKGGLLPQAYVYPPEMRATRDLLRRRLHFVRHRGQLLAHIQNTHHQYNLPTPGKRIAYRANREGICEGFEDASVTKSLEADVALIDHYDTVIRDLELTVLRRARGHDLDSFERLKTVPGIGKVLALTILYEIHDITRFSRVQEPVVSLEPCTVEPERDAEPRSRDRSRRLRRRRVWGHGHEHSGARRLDWTPSLAPPHSRGPRRALPDLCPSPEPDANGRRATGARTPAPLS